jgi:hypothetical protein
MQVSDERTKLRNALERDCISTIVVYAGDGQRKAWVSEAGWSQSVPHFMSRATKARGSGLHTRWARWQGL